MATREPSGAVHALLVEPKITTVGAPVAAARCARPESLQIVPAAPAQSASCSSVVVVPASERALVPIAPATASASARSFAAPQTNTPRPRSTQRRPNAAKRSVGQRLAGPYAAPGP